MNIHQFKTKELLRASREMRLISKRGNNPYATSTYTYRAIASNGLTSFIEVFSSGRYTETAL